MTWALVMPTVRRFVVCVVVWHPRTSKTKQMSGVASFILRSLHRHIEQDFQNQVKGQVLSMDRGAKVRNKHAKERRASVLLRRDVSIFELPRQNQRSPLT